MTYAVPNTATHAAIITIHFDEGEPEQQVVAFGSFEECDDTARMLPATSYSGSRTAVSAQVGVFPLVPFCQSCGQRHDDACAVTRALCTRCELKPASDADLCSSCHDKLGAAQDARAAEGT